MPKVTILIELNGEGASFSRAAADTPKSALRVEDLLDAATADVADWIRKQRLAEAAAQ